MPYKNEDVRREYQAKWIAERKRQWFEDKCCRNCGSKENLELDHVDPSKKFTHRIWSYSWDKIMKETKKCQVLCSSCHAKKTAQDVMKMKQKAHGSLEGYEKWHCRCESCNKFAFRSKDEQFAGITLDEAKELVLA